MAAFFTNAKHTYTLLTLPPEIEKPFYPLKAEEPHTLREIIQNLESACKNEPVGIDVEIGHYFSKGIYAREMRLDQGTMIVGKIHKFENLCILSQGEVSVLSEEGVIRIKAPATFVAPPGSKRVIYAHTDVTWTTIHGTNERDLEKIEDEVIAKSYDEVVYLQGEDKKCLG